MWMFAHTWQTFKRIEQILEIWEQKAVGETRAVVYLYIKAEHTKTQIEKNLLINESLKGNSGTGLP